jgi:RNA 3'-terminal phosphate cyclase (ATP)
LALSVVTGTPVRIFNIRAKRKRPGLLRQHLTGVQAISEICGGEVEGDHLGSREVVLHPGAVVPGDYRFSIGTAGSACLVFQTVLPPLMLASGPTTVTIEGGTHNSKAPPYHFLDRAFLPLLERMGVRVDRELTMPGFYPVGGGSFTATVHPVAKLTPIEVTQLGKLRKRRATALISNLPATIGEREVSTVRRKLDWHERECHVEHIAQGPGPGNALMLEIEHANVTELITAFGEKGVPAERVAQTAAKAMRRYLRDGAPVGEHLADQLMIPMALAGSGRYVTGSLSLHSRTNLDVICDFLDVPLCGDTDGKRTTIKFG